MSRSSSLYVCILLLSACYLDVRATQIQDTPQTLSPSPVVPHAVIDKYCVSCHNDRLKVAGLVLDKADVDHAGARVVDRKSTRLNSSHDQISYAAFCLQT